MEAAEFDLIVAGAGPAGSACAITAARAGARVLLLEKDTFPRHKVCGEFVSSESLRVLATLAGEQTFLALPEISSARIFLDGKMLRLPVSPLARSIPRFDLDALLFAAAQTAGAQVREETIVRKVGPEKAHPKSQGAEEQFEVLTGNGQFRAKAVVNATGRWSQLTQYAPEGGGKWIGIKAHYRESAPPSSVDLYFFSGGYCGVQPAGRNTVNACAMVRADVATSLPEVFALHPELWRRSRDWEPLFPAVTTAALHFREPQTEHGGMLLAGDAAGFIDPFAGDGISLALHSGVLAARCLLPFFSGECDRAEAHARYRTGYRRRLAPALRNAARLRRLLSAPAWLRSRLIGFAAMPVIGRQLVRATRVRM